MIVVKSRTRLSPMGKFRVSRVQVAIRPRFEKAKIFQRVYRRSTARNSFFILYWDRSGEKSVNLPIGCNHKSRQDSHFRPEFVVMAIRRVIHKRLVRPIQCEMQSPKTNRRDCSFSGDHHASLRTNETASANVHLFVFNHHVRKRSTWSHKPSRVVTAGGWRVTPG
jgi:hypothetical protein